MFMLTGGRNKKVGQKNGCILGVCGSVGVYERGWRWFGSQMAAQWLEQQTEKDLSHLWTWLREEMCYFCVSFVIISKCCSSFWKEQMREHVPRTVQVIQCLVHLGTGSGLTLIVKLSLRDVISHWIRKKKLNNIKNTSLLICEDRNLCRI